MKSFIDVQIFRDHPDVILPTYGSEDAAGIDLYSYSFEIPSDMNNLVKVKNDECEIKPFGRVMIHTGIHMAIPKGYYLAIVPRSGMACKKDLIVANTPGTIDADYRGEIMICLKNLHPTETRTIKIGERVCQGIFLEYKAAKFLEVQTLEDLGTTDRGQGGFGSTGTEQMQDQQYPKYPDEGTGKPVFVTGAFTPKVYHGVPSDSDLGSMDEVLKKHHQKRENDMKDFKDKVKQNKDKDHKGKNEL